MPDYSAKEKIFLAWKKFTGYESKVKLFEVDFNKPWTQVIGKQKWLFGLGLLNSGLITMTNILAPVIIGLAIGSNNWLYGIGVILTLLLINFISYNLYYFDPLLELQTRDSVAASSYDKLLKVDPLAHTYRSSGQILSKVNRGSSATQTLLSQIQTVVFSLLVSIISVSWVLLSFDLIIGLIALASLSGICLISFLVTKIAKEIGNPFGIAAEDEASAVNTESLLQVQYIRSIFATTDQLNKLWQTNKESTITRSAHWRFNGTTITMTKVLFVLSFAIVGYLVFGSSKFDSITKVSLLVTYWGMSSIINLIGINLALISQNLSYVQDLFKFMKEFGVSSYPVVDEVDINK